uniref:LBH domain-containing protein n=1 Tax=Chelydra serpentina TaxID=8475 RepID=A0A8C3XSN0_CHESE
PILISESYCPAYPLRHSRSLGSKVPPAPKPTPLSSVPSSSWSHVRWAKGKARLPSIVVEPTEAGEVESGELRWPPDDFLLLEGEDELFTDEEERKTVAGS